MKGTLEPFSVEIALAPLSVEERICPFVVETGIFRGNVWRSRSEGEEDASTLRLEIEAFGVVILVRSIS